jgi:hypothetical protein
MAWKTMLDMNSRRFFQFRILQRCRSLRPVRAMDSVSINSPVNIKMKIAGLIFQVVTCG